MNRISGHISEIISEGHMSVVKVSAAGTTFTAIVTDVPDSAPYLMAGNEVSVIFKENEVVVAKGLSGMISMQNRLECTITGLNIGKLLAEIRLDYKGTKIISLITAQSAKYMGLAIGDIVTALIKTNEVSLSA